MTLYALCVKMFSRYVHAAKYCEYACSTQSFSAAGTVHEQTWILDCIVTYVCESALDDVLCISLKKYVSISLCYSVY